MARAAAPGATCPVMAFHGRARLPVEAGHHRLRRDGPGSRARVDGQRDSCRTWRAGMNAAGSTISTTHSPESPTAWASFATGVNAGKHNIYDFLVRDTATYLPDLGMVKREPPRFLFNYIPTSRRRSHCGRARRHVVLGHRRPGRRAQQHPDGAGHVPAGRRAQRRAALGPAAARHPRHDGHLLLLRHGPEPLRGGQHRVGRHPARLVFDGDVARTELVGTAQPHRAAADARDAGEGHRSTTPTERIGRARSAGRAAADSRSRGTAAANRDVDIDGQTVTLGEQQWSRGSSSSSA
jgi:hypothetical protein